MQCIDNLELAVHFLFWLWLNIYIYCLIQSYHQACTCRIFVCVFLFVYFLFVFICFNWGGGVSKWRASYSLKFAFLYIANIRSNLPPPSSLPRRCYMSGHIVILKNNLGYGRKKTTYTVIMICVNNLWISNSKSHMTRFKRVFIR